MYALEIEDLYKTYENGFEALKGINLKVKNGDFFALLGANGAGKSTTISVISTLLIKTRGTIKINGFDLNKNAGRAKANLGLVPQEINLNIFETCYEILINQAGYYGIPKKIAHQRAIDLLKQLSLSHKTNTIVRHLSGGLKRRLMIARALIHNPSLLILDEPTAGVDVEIRHELWKFLRKINTNGTTIILTTHYLEEAESLCKNIAIIDHGILVEHSSMDKLIRSIKHHTFIFTTASCDPDLGYFEKSTNFGIERIDPFTFEMRIDNNWTLNKVFALLSEKGIIINSMRNKTNRLEELFLDRIKHGH